MLTVGSISSNVNVKEVMGAEKFTKLESGAVRTLWLGQGDFCNSQLSIFNPAKGSTGLPGFVGKASAFGSNAGPPEGSTYCHYDTGTTPTIGLNKDEPGSTEPSHVNHGFAKDAAQAVSGLVWKEFERLLAKTTPERCPEALAGSCPAPGYPDPPYRWAGQWTSSFGGFGLRVETKTNGRKLLEQIGGKPCSGSSQYYAGGYNNPDDAGKFRGCTQGLNHLVGRFESNRTKQQGSFDITRSGSTWKGTWSLDSGDGGKWDGKFIEHFDGDRP